MIGSRIPNEDSQIDSFIELELASIPEKKEEKEEEKHRNIDEDQNLYDDKNISLVDQEL